MRAKATNLPDPQSVSGAVLVVVSLDRQKLSVYEGTRMVGASRVSTGRSGFVTPTGAFSVIQKKRRHYSNIYDRASMPFMQRLTWSGLALHAGVVPRYPASHGCIRLPRTFARGLYRFSRRRDHVVVVRDNNQPREITHSALFQPGKLPKPKNQHLSDAPPKAYRLALIDTVGTSAKIDALPLVRIGAPTPSLEAHASATSNVYDAVDNQDLANERLAKRAAKSKAPLRILITQRSGRDYVREAQRLLEELGYDPGPKDGRIGARTLKAINSFERQHALQVSTQLSPQLYEELRKAARRGSLGDGVLRVRQNGKDIFRSYIDLARKGEPLGTNLYILETINSVSGTATWTGITIKSSEKTPRQENEARSDSDRVHSTTRGALDRISIPAHVRRYIEDLLTPGSSVIVTDGKYEGQTRKGTDFVVLTD